MCLLPWILLVISLAVVFYHRWPAPAWGALASLSILVSWMAHAPDGSVVAAALTAFVLSALWLTPFIRRPLISAPLLGVYRKLLPPLSETERVALAAGTVGFEGELFSGKPNWSKLLDQPAPRLTNDELLFLQGPVEEVCAMVDDWKVSHELADLPVEVWDFLRQYRFFGMIIPREYGGLGFSAYAHHCVVQKLASRSVALSTTVGVPNSLGPAELLMHYGTRAQKDYYLPRLANGKEIPCFALTGPHAGSDATSIPDFGIVSTGMWEGQEVLGVRLTFDKRYITLAPVATLIGVAFRMHDPDNLLGRGSDIGISLALVPRDTAGVKIGRRHFPLNAQFQNGPIQGNEVFVPMTQLIGGAEYAGKGWQMLVECLSIGRSITLPSMSSGGAKFIAVATGSYARMRKQFGLSIGRFEGVEEALARIAGRTYAISALARATAAAVDRGEKPAVPSAIAKYHCTETGRSIVQDAMDIHGGKGIILGPRNYLARAWQYSPIGITVEGANIMTRTLLIFGQGAILCHPWVMKEMIAAQNPDQQAGARQFDESLAGHLRSSLSNGCRAFWFGLTGSSIGSSPGDDYTRRFYRKLNRYSAALSLMADVSMLTLGGKLKLKEILSGRLADVLSHLYIASAMLKSYEDEGSPEADRPLLSWAIYDGMHTIENALSASLRNFPSRPMAWLMWCLIFPWGRRAVPPSDRLGHKAASILLSPGEARDRLAEGVYLTPGPGNPAGRIVSYLEEAVSIEPLERKFIKLLKGKGVEALSFDAQLDEAIHEKWITPEERVALQRLHDITLDAISVDDFDPSELRRD